MKIDKINRNRANAETTHTKTNTIFVFVFPSVFFSSFFDENGFYKVEKHWNRLYRFSFWIKYKLNDFLSCRKNWPKWKKKTKYYMANASDCSIFLIVHCRINVSLYSSNAKQMHRLSFSSFFLHFFPPSNAAQFSLRIVHSLYKKYNFSVQIVWEDFPICESRFLDSYIRINVCHQKRRKSCYIATQITLQI